MTITIRVNDDEAHLIKSYAKTHKKPVSEIMRAFTLEKIEDEIDLQAYIQAMAEHKRNPQVVSFEDVWKEINA